MYLDGFNYDKLCLFQLIRTVGLQGDADFLREGLKVLAEAVMDVEVSQQIGVERFEHTENCRNDWNGDRTRKGCKGGNKSRMEDDFGKLTEELATMTFNKEKNMIIPVLTARKKGSGMICDRRHGVYMRLEDAVENKRSNMFIAGADGHTYHIRETEALTICKKARKVSGVPVINLEGDEFMTKRKALLTAFILVNVLLGKMQANVTPSKENWVRASGRMGLAVFEQGLQRRAKPSSRCNCW